MKRIWGLAGRDEALENLAKDFVKTPNNLKEKKAVEIKDYLIEKCKDLSDSSVKQYFKTVRRHVKELDPEIPKNCLPKCPENVFKRVKLQEKKQIEKRFDDPAIINSEVLIDRLLSGLREGLRKKQCPQILFCLNYLIPTRVNDLNCLHERVGEDKNKFSNENTHIFNRQNGNLLNLFPSKKQEKSIRKYSTVCICDPRHYELVSSALEFVRSDEALSLPLITTVAQFLNENPSGPIFEAGGKRLRPWKKIDKVMINDMNLNDAVESWGSLNPRFTRQLGRSFAACCVEQGIFELERGLCPTKAVELFLGHEPLSSANVSYLRIDVKPKRMKNVVLRKVCENNCLNHGEEKISYGVMLEHVVA